MPDGFLMFFVIGGLAQLVDGALGMAYGVIATSCLLSLGVAPAVTSASVRICKIATGAASGFSHALLGNVERHLLLRLAIPGAIGGMVGAFALTSLPGDSIRPFIAVYLLLVGLLILHKALRSSDSVAQHPRRLGPLGLIGGFLDSIGGGGWGPIVTSGLLTRGVRPAAAIGSANFAEFLVAICASAVFDLEGDLFHWDAIAGLIVGGVVMAPVAAYFCKRIPARPLLVAVALTIIVLSVLMIYDGIGAAID